MSDNPSATTPLFVLKDRAHLLQPQKTKVISRYKTERQSISDEFNGFEDFYIVEALSLYTLQKFSFIDEYSISITLLAKHIVSLNTNYYSYILNAVCSASGIFKSLDISPASVYDANYL